MQCASQNIRTIIDLGAGLVRYLCLYNVIKICILFYINFFCIL